MTSLCRCFHYGPSLEKNFPLHYGPSLEKNFPLHNFSLSAKNFCFSLVFCENFQYLITFNEVSECVDGLQIRVNLANPKIKNSVVLIFDSNLSFVWRMIFQNLKKFQNIIFHSKLIAIRNIYGFSHILGHLMYNKMYGKTHIEFTVELCERFLRISPYHVVDIIDS